MQLYLLKPTLSGMSGLNEKITFMVNVLEGGIRGQFIKGNDVTMKFLRILSETKLKL